MNAPSDAPLARGAYQAARNPLWRTLLDCRRRAPAPRQGRVLLSAHATRRVVFAESTEEVAEIVALCHEFPVPVIAFGTGTSLEGHLLAVNGGICIDLSA
jgi:FAD/FMN-containing dehydrogenase